MKQKPLTLYNQPHKGQKQTDKGDEPNNRAGRLIYDMLLLELSCVNTKFGTKNKVTPLKIFVRP